MAPGFKLHASAAAGRFGDVDERVQGEAVHPAAPQVMHARLSDSAAVRDVGLRPTRCFDKGRDLPLRLGAYPQIRR